MQFSHFLQRSMAKRVLNYNEGDMIVCGRGKIGGSGRGPEFRSEVNKMSAALYRRTVSKREVAALGDVGKVLGSVAEGILVASAGGGTVPISATPTPTHLEGVDLIVVQGSHGGL